jgi:hypothetical protein
MSVRRVKVTRHFFGISTGDIQGLAKKQLKGLAKIQLKYPINN